LVNSAIANDKFHSSYLT